MQLDRRSRMYVAMVLVAYMAYEAKVQLARNVLFTTGGGVKHLEESLAASVDAGKLGGGAPTAHGKADVHGAHAAVPASGHAHPKRVAARLLDQTAAAEHEIEDDGLLPRANAKVSERAVAFANELYDLDVGHLNNARTLSDKAARLAHTLLWQFDMNRDGYLRIDPPGCEAAGTCEAEADGAAMSVMLFFRGRGFDHHQITAYAKEYDVDGPPVEGALRKKDHRLSGDELAKMIEDFLAGEDPPEPPQDEGEKPEL